MSKSLTIFADPNTFEEYHQGVLDRLRSRWDEQAQLFRAATERLESLRRIAQAVQDGELEKELAEHLELASERLRVLDSVRPGGER